MPDARTPITPERRAQMLAELHAAVREYQRADRDRAIRSGRRVPRTAREQLLAEEGRAAREARIERARRRRAKRLAREALDDPRPAAEPINLDARGNP